MEAGRISLSALFSGRSATKDAALAEITALEPMLRAIRRGVGWLRAMQSRDGGWGAFDADNTREVFARSMRASLHSTGSVSIAVAGIQLVHDHSVGHVHNPKRVTGAAAVRAARSAPGPSHRAAAARAPLRFPERTSGGTAIFS